MNIWKHAVVIAAGLTLSGSAFAQDPTGIASELERTAQTSPDEKLAYAEVSNKEIEEASKQVTKLLEAARRDSDLEGLQCLTSRLTSVRALGQVSTQAEATMKSALASGETERANHEFRKIAVAVSKTRILLAEAERCTTQTALVEGEGRLVEWTTSLVGDQGEGEVWDLDALDVGNEPPDASPFL